MRILVTGASGFVGRHVRSVLSDSFSDSLSVFTLSRADTGGSSHHAVDLTDARAVRDALRDVAPDCVLHLAAVAQVGADDDAMIDAVNVDGAAHVADALWTVRPDARLVAVSTGYVLGETAAPAPEGALVQPIGPYATSKARMERVVQDISQGRDLCVVRPFNHTGPGQAPSYAVAAFARKVGAALRRAGPSELSVGDLSAVRDLSDVRDLAAVLAHLVTAGQPPPLVHVCSGVGRSMATVLDDLCDLAGLDRQTLTIHTAGRSALRRNVGRPTRLPGVARPILWRQTLLDVLAEHAGPWE